MLPSIVHFRDLVSLLERVREKGGGAIGRIVGGNDQRVRRKWGGELGSHCRHWYEIPAVERRWNRMITGDEGCDPWNWVSDSFLSDRNGLRGLSLGCGAGGREMRWWETGRFSSIEGVDLSPERVAVASQRAADRGLEDRLRFTVGDVRRLVRSPGSYDVIVAEQALHHFTPLSAVIADIRGWLREDGLLVVNEFVGASRFQWTQRQLDAVNGLLMTMPGRFRSTGDGGTKGRVWRPGRLTMYLNDPSEAVESSSILPLLKQEFEQVVLRGYGGTILQLLLKDIAHHFVDESDHEAQRLLRLCFEAEDILLEAGEIQHDFIFGVFRTQPKRKPL